MLCDLPTEALYRRQIECSLQRIKVLVLNLLGGTEDIGKNCHPDQDLNQVLTEDKH